MSNGLDCDEFSEREKEELARACDLLQTRGAGNYHAGGYYGAGPSYMPNYP